MGIISGLIVLFYILISYGIYRLLLKTTNRKVLSRVIFALILTFPFWDLIVQKGIKTFYQTSGLFEPKIYTYPERDKDGKIESLGFDRGLSFKYASSYWFKDQKKFKEHISKNPYIIFSKKILYYYESLANSQIHYLI